MKDLAAWQEAVMAAGGYFWWTLGGVSIRLGNVTGLAEGKGLPTFLAALDDIAKKRLGNR